MVFTSQGDKIKGVCRIEPPEELYSQLIEKARENKEPFALVMFNYNDESLTLQRFKVIINDPEYRPLCTDEEMKSMKGLGKILLIKTLKFLLFKNYITPSTDIELYASPFLACNFSRETVLFERYIKISDDESISKLKQYPKIFENYKGLINFVENKREVLAKFVCIIDHLLNLIEYYKHLGFTPTIEKEDYDTSVPMISTVERVINA